MRKHETFFAQDRIEPVWIHVHRVKLDSIIKCSNKHARRNFNFEHTYGVLREFDFFFTFSRSVLFVLNLLDL